MHNVVYDYKDSTFNDAYAHVAKALGVTGEKTTVRGTTTVECMGAWIRVEHPQRRLVTCYGRNINVAFALAEAIWILGGRRDVEMLKFYNSKIAQFSDDSKVFNAAYGYRLRQAHGYDQIEDAILTLQDDPGSRRAVMTIWHPDDRGWVANPADHPAFDVHLNHTKDRACNVLAHPMVRNGKLWWFQTVRSNDLVLGVPYNWMQWTHVQEYMARRLQVEVGPFINEIHSLHAYIDTYYTLESLQRIQWFDLYSALSYEHKPMVACTPQHINQIQEVEESIRLHPARNVSWELDDYWEGVMQVLYAHHLYRLGQDEAAYVELATCPDEVYGAAQIKFYWQNRWHKARHAYIAGSIDQDWPDPVVKWIKELG